MDDSRCEGATLEKLVLGLIIVIGAAAFTGSFTYPCHSCYHWICRFNLQRRCRYVYARSGETEVSADDQENDESPDYKAAVFYHDLPVIEKMGRFLFGPVVNVVGL